MHDLCIRLRSYTLRLCAKIVKIMYRGFGIGRHLGWQFKTRAQQNKHYTRTLFQNANNALGMVISFKIHQFKNGEIAEFIQCIIAEIINFVVSTKMTPISCWLHHAKQSIIVTYTNSTRLKSCTWKAESKQARVVCLSQETSKTLFELEWS